jgi:GntR family transcriptional repressor for pyruvate dehydrogenase complex
MGRVDGTAASEAASPTSAVQHPFHSISGPRAFEEVVDQITFAIRAGYYQVDEWMPTIDELSRIMNVSKPAIGDALRVLADARVLDVRRGARGGVRVASGSIPAGVLRLSRTARGRSLAALVEARRPVEVALARMASVRATTSEMAELEASIVLLEGARGSKPEWEHAQNLFHYIIGRAARSPMLAQFQHEVLEEITILLDGYDERYSDPERTIREHHDTFAAIRSGDPDRAEASMDEHLRELEELALAQPTIGLEQV